MTIVVTVTAKGQITLRKPLLRHLGVRPGDKLEVDLLNNGRLQLEPQRGTPIDSVFGMLARPGTPQLSVEELNEVAASGWASDS